MESGISITRLPYDDDAWHVQFRASDGQIATAIDFYTQPEDLAQFSSLLCAFPRGIHDEARFEIGSDIGRWAYHVCVRANCFDSKGHSALEILTDNRIEFPDHARVHFSIRCEAAAINRLGGLLSEWIKNSATPLIWELKER